MGYKAAETTCNINNAPRPGTANEHTVQWWFKKFCKGDENPENEKRGGWPLEVDNDQLRGASKLILLQPHRKLPKNSTSTILQSFGLWSKTERWQTLISGCLISWPQIKIKPFFKVSPFLILCNNNESFLDLIVTCDEKCLLDDNQLSGWTKNKLQSTSQSQTCTKKWGSWSLFGGLMPVWSTTAFWIPVKPLHLRSMLSKQWEAGKTATPAVGTGQQNGTHSSPQQCLTTSHNEHVASSMNWTKFKVLPHLPYSPDLLPTYYFVKHLNNFLQGKCFHNQEDAENAFQEFIVSGSTDFFFMLQE